MRSEVTEEPLPLRLLRRPSSDRRGLAPKRVAFGCTGLSQCSLRVRLCQRDKGVVLHMRMCKCYHTENIECPAKTLHFLNSDVSDDHICNSGTFRRCFRPLCRLISWYGRHRLFTTFRKPAFKQCSWTRPNNSGVSAGCSTSTVDVRRDQGCTEPRLSGKRSRTHTSRGTGHFFGEELGHTLNRQCVRTSSRRRRMRLHQ